MQVRALLAVLALGAAARASALQPIDAFLRAARAGSAESAEARAARRQLRAEADAALGRVLPRLSVQGQYTRNQYASTLAFPDPGGGPPAQVTVTPRDQLDGFATLEVPLVDLAGFARVGAARSGARAAEAREDATDLAVQSRVSQEYHQLVANVALLESSRRALEVARESARIAERRLEVGAVGRIDVDRAHAEVERNVQQVAAAELGAALSARALQSLTGLAPALDGPVALSDDLHEEPPLERFQAPDEELPALAAAIQDRVAAERRARAERLTLAPSLGASVTQRVSDYEGLAGRDASWQAVVGLRWSFDLTTVAGIRAQAAAAAGARAREQRTRLDVRDDIHAAWRTVQAGIARSRSARVQAEVSARAAGLARSRYEVGEGPQLELLQAQRDAFAADAGRIQADADLQNARLQLRAAAGEDLLAPPRRAR
jgi:outer membrane protein TolC